MFRASRWKTLRINITELMPGDVIFVREMTATTFISHVAVAINNQQLFHCSRKISGAEFIRPSLFFETHEQFLELKKMVAHIDFRDEPERTRCGSPFLDPSLVDKEEEMRKRDAIESLIERRSMSPPLLLEGMYECFSSSG